MKRNLWLVLTLVSFISCYNPKESKKSCCSTESKETASSSTSELSDSSVYQLDAEWQDQNGTLVSLTEYAGKPVIMTMIFTHCEYACPMMVSDLKKIESQFSDSEKEQFQFVLVSFDNVRDNPERLKDYAETQELGKNWVLLHGNADQIKDLSVVLNISYELQDDGSFAHANRKLLLDKQGSIIMAQDGLKTGDNQIVEKLKSKL